MSNTVEPPVFSADQQRIGLRQCWEARGRGGFLVTHLLGYTLGSVLAPAAHRLRVTPNTVTVFSLLTALLAVVPVAAGVFSSRALEGLYLAVVLLISYGWDCADGVLARVTQKCSPFGVLWDKIVDLLSLYGIGIFLGFAAKASPPQIPFLAGAWTMAFPILLMWSIVPKTLLSVFSWLKDQQLNGMSRTKERTNKMSAAARLRRIAGNLTDEPVFRLGLGVAWGFGYYWEYVIVFHSAAAVMFIGYVADTWRRLRV